MALMYRRYASNAISPGVIYSSPKQDPPYYFEGNPMNVRCGLGFTVSPMHAPLVKHEGVRAGRSTYSPGLACL